VRVVRGGEGRIQTKANKITNKSLISCFLDFLRSQTNHREIIVTEKCQHMDEDAIPEPQSKVLK